MSTGYADNKCFAYTLLVLRKKGEGETCLVMGNMIGQCKSGLTCKTDKTSPVGLGYCRGGK